MKLYMIPACPFVHRVLLACHVRQINKLQIQSIEIDLNKPPAGMLQINPSGSVPTLEFETGQGFHESLVIMEFLDSLEAKGPKIYGTTPRQIAQTKVLRETANSNLLSALQQAIYSNGNTNSLNAAAKRLATAWAWLDEMLSAQGHRFFGGNELNAIDIAIAPFLVRLKYVTEIHKQIELPNPKTRAGQYLTDITECCRTAGILPEEAIMRETTLRFARPHALFIDVQNASRTLMDDPRPQVKNAGEALSSWSVDRDSHGFCLSATFNFKTHAEAVERMNWLHDAHEICDHHTSFLLRDFTSIEISLVTHEPRWGVTEKDFAMAKLIQAYFNKGSLTK
ncbi:MAG: glutathione S-transferase N-terminal domain-containing protein [Silvanigrellaceae bacterium]